MTSWIDGSFVYSTSEAWVNSMRSFQNGTLKTDPSGKFPPRNTARAPLINSPPARYLKKLSPERMFLLGDPRSNQNPALLAFGIVFFRWHNEVARQIQEQHPDWSDEDIFQRARRWVIASLQNVILYEYVPTLLEEEISPYSGYKPDVHPGICHVFQSAAFRFSHTMIPPGLYRSPQGSQLESLFTLPSNQSESSYLALSQVKNFEKPPSRQSTVATPPGSYRPANRHHATQQNVKHHFRHAPHRRHVLIWD
ncbi:dual oxidase [Trichonephila clavipes]|nr:dual oxidase [Trichonephila clavipes]